MEMSYEHLMRIAQESEVDMAMATAQIGILQELHRIADALDRLAPKSGG